MNIMVDVFLIFVTYIIFLLVIFLALSVMIPSMAWLIAKVSKLIGWDE